MASVTVIMFTKIFTKYLQKYLQNIYKNIGKLGLWRLQHIQDLHDALKVTQSHVAISYRREIKCCNPNPQAMSN